MHSTESRLTAPSGVPDSAHVIRQAGLKVTAGRIAVLEALTKAPHADAHDLFVAVSADLPVTSPQAVHGVLSAFCEAGLARRIEPAGSAARYELRVGDNHHHAICTQCGAVSDIDCVTGQAPCLTPDDAAGFAIHTAEVTFWGLCASCRQGDAS